MTEQTLNNPLSGAEVVEALVDQLRTKLQRDCYLNPNSAYDYFSATIAVSIQMHDAGALVPVSVTLTVASGVEPPDDSIETVEGVVEIPMAPPNEVRVKTGQGVPTMTKDANGNTVVKPVRYSRDSAARKATA